MSRSTRSHPLRPLVVTALVVLGLAASAATIHAQSPGPERALLNRLPAATYRVIADSDRTSAYFAEFTGVGPEGRDMVWRGAVAGAAVGELIVRLAPERGTIDWRRKRLTLAGEVSVGYLRGAHVEQTADLIDHDLSGELRLTPWTLTAAR
jgi:hypothetical protein